MKQAISILLKVDNGCSDEDKSFPGTNLRDIWVILVTFGYFSLPCWQTNKLCVLYRISDSFATFEDGKSPNL